MSCYYHLAQVNVARMKGGLDDPRMAGFVERIDDVNALAAASPGFVWTPTGEELGGEYSNPFDELTLFNLSLWNGIESLQQFVYGLRHRDVMRQKGDWFHPPTEAHMALWWIPAGSLPRATDAAARLGYFRERGASPFAFSFKSKFDEPAVPETSPGVEVPHVTYGGRSFRCIENSENGAVGDETIFHYGQDGARVWATYSGNGTSGNGTKFGTLVAVSDRDGKLDARYQHMSPDGLLKCGVCASSPTVLPDGRLTVQEKWQWTSGDRSSGISTIEELRR